MAEIKDILSDVKELLDRSGLIIERVDTKQLLNEVLKLRYRVYYRECKFLKDQNHSHMFESDKYDSYAVHFAASNQQGVIGTLRLVFDSPYGFPFEEPCRGKLYIDTNKSFRKEAAEISRLMISKSFRRAPAGDRGLPDRFENKRSYSGLELFVLRIKPIALGMYRAMYLETKSRGIKYWFALMEEPLQALLNMYGFKFTRIGEDVDLCGRVAPYIASVKNIEKSLREQFPLFMRK